MEPYPRVEVRCQLVGGVPMRAIFFEVCFSRVIAEQDKIIPMVLV